MRSAECGVRNLRIRNMATKVHIENAQNKLRALANVLHRPLRDVLDSGARVMAIEFAKTSQPFGTGFDARDSGHKAVARDIYRVYTTPGKAFEDIASGSYRGSNGERMEALFWRAYKDGNIADAQSILDKFGVNLRNVPMVKMDGGGAHRAARNATTGRVHQTRPEQIIINPKALERYVKAEQDKVGTGKGGWADVARQISGSIRGLRSEGDITANWITRRGQGSGQVSRSGTDENPVITITSTIPYARNILNGTAESRSKAIARHRMLENLQIAVRAETRKLRSAA